MTKIIKQDIIYQRLYIKKGKKKTLLKARLNHQIKAPEVRVITEDGQQLGIMTISKAIALAVEHGLDLVEVAPQAAPPVCKIIDYAKYKYQQNKAESQAKKHAHKTEIKTIWISVRISDHDMAFKAKKVDEFLSEGNVVKIELRMRGREQAFGDLGRQQLEKFLSLITQPKKIDSPIKRMGGTWSITVAPAK